MEASIPFKPIEEEEVVDQAHVDDVFSQLMVTIFKIQQTVKTKYSYTKFLNKLNLPEQELLKTKLASYGYLFDQTTVFWDSMDKVLLLQTNIKLAISRMWNNGDIMVTLPLNCDIDFYLQLGLDYFIKSRGCDYMVETTLTGNKDLYITSNK